MATDTSGDGYSRLRPPSAEDALADARGYPVRGITARLSGAVPSFEGCCSSPCNPPGTRDRQRRGPEYNVLQGREGIRAAAPGGEEDRPGARHLIRDPSLRHRCPN